MRISLVVVLLLGGCGPKVIPVEEVTVESSGVEVHKAEMPTVVATDWAGWRGPSGNGVATDQAIPTQWSESENVVWKTEIPGRGHSSPTVCGDHIFLATAEESQQKQSVISINRASGKIEWQKTVSEGGFPGSGQMHPKSTHANGTVACDGEHIFAAFLANGEITAFALNLAGEELWKQTVCTFNSKFGYAPSPLLYKSIVIIAADNRGGGCVAALDRESGEIVWRKPRPAIATYSSPAVANVGGRDQLLLSGCNQVASYNPNTGESIWTYNGLAEATCGTMVWDDERVFASGGYPESETVCILADGSAKKVWSNSTRVYEPSMIVHEGNLYAITDKGIAHCFDATTGDEHWKKRLGGSFSASPVVCNDMITICDDRGKAYVFKASPAAFELVAENQLGSDSYASPAISDGQMFFRVGQEGPRGRQEMLYCIGEAVTE